MKTTFLFFLILFTALVSAAQNHAPVAVNDTLYGTVGNPVYVTRSFLLKNDYDPDGDSIFIKYVFGFQKVNDTTWKKTANINSTDSILTGRYIIRDEHNANSVLQDNIFTIVKGYLRYDSLNINNINALISPMGCHFFDFETAHFEVPKGTGKHSIFAHTMWVGGIRGDAQLCTVAERFRQDGSDFIVGPVTNSPDANYFLKWNREWKISKTQIQYHINNWNQPGYNPIEVIKNWPAHGDPSIGQSENIAPYYDKNSNGIYEPSSGDYPLIYGDEAVYFVFNDAKIQPSTLMKLGIEIHGMAYEYDRPNDSTLNNTLFIHYDIINRSVENYTNTYLGLFMDSDVGYALDDYIASDVSNGMMYGYNGTPVDGTGQSSEYGEHPPAIGLKIIGGPYLEPDGIDNLSGECGYSLNGLNFGDDIADNERIGMTNFIYYSGYPTYSGDTVTVVGNLYYNLMRGILAGGTHMIYGGNGQPVSGGVGPDCNFMFPGNSDTVCNYGTNGLLPNGGLNQNGNYWSEATVGNTPGDRNGLASIGPFNFNAGQSIPLDYCFTWAKDYSGDNNSSVKLLRERIEALSPHWNSLISAPLTYYGVPETGQSAAVTVYPNPVHNKATVTFDSKSAMDFQLYSIDGKCIKQGSLIPGTNILDVTTLKPGIYILKSGRWNSRIIKM